MISQSEIVGYGSATDGLLRCLILFTQQVPKGRFIGNRTLLLFPAFKGFLVEVAPFEMAGNDAIAWAQEVGEEEEHSEYEHDGWAGWDVCPEGNKKTHDGAECSKCGTSPKHDIEGIAEEVDGCSGEDEEAE